MAGSVDNKGVTKGLAQLGGCVVAMGALLLLLAAAGAYHDQPYARWVGAAGVAMGAFLLVGAWLLTGSYEWDDRGLAWRAMYGSWRMQWVALTSCAIMPLPNQAPIFVLTTRGGAKRRVSAYGRAERGRPLFDELCRRTADVRRADDERIATQGADLALRGRPKWFALAVMTGGMVAVTVLGATGQFARLVGTSNPRANLVAAGVGATMLALLAYMVLLRRKLCRTQRLGPDGITVGRGTETTLLAWHAVERVCLRRKADIILHETLVVSGGGQTVTLFSSAEPWLSVVRCVRLRAINAEFRDESDIEPHAWWAELLNPVFGDVPRHAAPSPAATRPTAARRLLGVVRGIASLALALSLNGAVGFGFQVAAVKGAREVPAYVTGPCLADPAHPGVMYQFAVGGQSHRGWFDAPGQTWRDYPVGTKLTVCYVVERPYYNWPRGGAEGRRMLDSARRHLSISLLVLVAAAVALAQCSRLLRAQQAPWKIPARRLGQRGR